MVIAQAPASWPLPTCLCYTKQIHHSIHTKPLAHPQVSSCTPFCTQPCPFFPSPPTSFPSALWNCPSVPSWKLLPICFQDRLCLSLGLIQCQGSTRPRPPAPPACAVLEKQGFCLLVPEPTVHPCSGHPDAQVFGAKLTWGGASWKKQVT